MDIVPLEDGDNTSQLDDLKAQATLKYSFKDYDAAADLYSYAVELQDEVNGEMSSENADLLYAYGRCLYHVAVKNSDVLGFKVAGEKREERYTRPKDRKQRKGMVPDELEGQEKGTAEEVVAKVVEEKDGPIKPEEDTEKENKPYFQFTGDENWDTSDDENNDAEGDAEEGEEADEDDDFANAYEVLDMARVLLQKKIAEAENGSGKGKEKGESPGMHQLNERLADTYDLQAEISLEGEHFPNAVVDLKSALELKKVLFPQESSLLAEGHYKLSLALEFSSIRQEKNENGEVEHGTESTVDDAMREEAAQEMEAAIASCKLRIQKEEAKLQNGALTNGDTAKPKVNKANVDGVKEMVKEMEQRVRRRAFPSVYDYSLTLPQLVELRQPPVPINDLTGMGTLDGSNPLSGILGQILGASKAAQDSRLEEASKGANDLTGFVKRKKPAQDDEGSKAANETPQTNGKRKIDSAEEMEEIGPGKKVKISDGGTE